jgi:hypothetical protein
MEVEDRIFTVGRIKVDGLGSPADYVVSKGMPLVERGAERQDE